MTVCVLHHAVPDAGRVTGAERGPDGHGAHRRAGVRHALPDSSRLRCARRALRELHLRRRLLAEVGIVLDGDIGLGGLRVGADDVLDAAVVAWTAQRVLRGEAFSPPDPPEIV